MKKLVLKTNELKKLTAEDIRNYVMLTKIYSDLTISLDSFFEISNFPLDGRINKDTKNTNLLHCFLQLVSHIYEANIFFKEGMKLSDKEVGVKEKYFEDIRNNIGYHYNRESTDLPLYKIFIETFFINQDKPFIMFLNTDNYKGIFPSTTELIWLFIYIIDKDVNWKNQLINEPEIINKKLSSLSSGNQDQFEFWLNKTLDKIINSSKLVIKTCSEHLTNLLVVWDEG